MKQRIMKNIHIIPTDKPSRLVKNNLGIAINEDFTQSILDLIQATFVNIYITNSEEIKEGDWCYDKVLNLIFQTDNHTDFKYANQTDSVLKIILTTDQDLIADGVQAIDDEFLKWFVKNPSCEYVEVSEYFKPSNMVYGHNTEPYRIIIPQEKPKQETIEEVAEKLFPVFQRSTPFGEKYPWTPHKEREAFKRGAKWQAKRMYSEKEVLDLLQNFNQNAMEYIKEDEKSIMTSVSLKKWFEQHKKK